MKTIVITGASQGVGLEIAKAFVQKSWNVVGLSRSEDKLASAKQLLGPDFHYFGMDVKNPKEVATTFSQISERFKTLDVLVNNAAVFKMAKFSECSVIDINNMIDTNLKGTMFCTMEAVKLMRPGSRIVNIGSVAGTHGIKNQAIYCASKFGMDGFAEALNQELVEKGITITTICPGGINTPLWDEKTNPYPGNLEQLLQPQDISKMVEYVSELPANVLLKKAVVFPTNEWH